MIVEIIILMKKVWVDKIPIIVPNEVAKLVQCIFYKINKGGLEVSPVMSGQGSATRFTAAGYL